MLTKKHARIQSIALQIACLGLSVADTHRLAKRIESQNIHRFGLDITLGKVDSWLTESDGKFAFRKTGQGNGEHASYLFYGPTGLIEIGSLFHDIQLARKYNPLKRESFETSLLTSANWTFIQESRSFSSKESNIAA